MRWLSSLVPLLLVGCATAPVTLPPPEDLLLDCLAPAISVKTNGEMADTLSKFRTALRECNDDKAALRKLYEPN